MDRAFLDANVLFSIAYDPAARIGRLLDLPDTQVVTSSHAAAEAARNVDAKAPDRLPDLLDMLRKMSLVPESPEEPLAGETSLPEDDRPILQAAIACRATHLLTGDSDFRGLFGRVLGGVLILRPGDYLRLREQG